MPNYENSKIYKIVSNGDSKCYIGSTTLKTLAKRLAVHKCQFKKGIKITSGRIIATGDYNIVLIEKYPCNSKDELHARERYWIDHIECVNKGKPLTEEERTDYYKKYCRFNYSNNEAYRDKIRTRNLSHYHLKKELALQRNILLDEA